MKQTNLENYPRIQDFGCIWTFIFKKLSLASLANSYFRLIWLRTRPENIDSSMQHIHFISSSACEYINTPIYSTCLNSFAIFYSRSALQHTTRSTHQQINTSHTNTSHDHTPTHHTPTQHSNTSTRDQHNNTSTRQHQVNAVKHQHRHISTRSRHEYSSALTHEHINIENFSSQKNFKFKIFENPKMIHKKSWWSTHKIVVEGVLHGDRWRFFGAQKNKQTNLGFESGKSQN